ncbi:Larval cuticle protein LCP-17-like 1 [Homarus americanus]|uniref:Larval cuticle protein LCP-17-like 1 n=2 Tax=Homarus americanus TaxID=6706 RepID=A0A8J5MZA7_HOMAM|nr:Larval cuticle protein LCP-17-like 1 [Homarus americanus]
MWTGMDLSCLLLWFSQDSPLHLVYIYWAAANGRITSRPSSPATVSTLSLPAANMRFIGVVVVAASLVLLTDPATADPSSPYRPSPYRAPVIPILKDDRTQDRFGGYSFSYNTGNGIYRNEEGKQSYGQNSEGGWSYTSPEGVPVRITFVANQGGYQPVGDVIPVPPPLPYSRTQRY